MKYFILAGEASGDKQAALLCEAILHADPHAKIQGWGGEDMESKGATITRHYRELAFMGFVEVVKHLPAIFRNFKLCKKEILDYDPDALILIDYPGFNLRMAAWAAEKNLSVYYYISPQLWAWHTSRVHKIKRAVRKMFVILPFEKEFYAQYGVEAIYIGHPLALDIVNDINPGIERKSKQIAFLPGSRKHEVELVLPEMMGLAELLPDHHFVIVAVPHLPLELYHGIISDQKNISISVGNMRSILRESEAAIVTSGTATLETALLETPQIVVYKGNPFSYQLAKRLVKVPYISLVNLIADKKLVPELIQSECNAELILENLHAILKPEHTKSILAGYRKIIDQLTHGGGPKLAAEHIVSDLHQLKKK